MEKVSSVFKYWTSYLFGQPTGMRSGLVYSLVSRRKRRLQSTMHGVSLDVDQIMGNLVRYSGINPMKYKISDVYGKNNQLIK